LQTAYEAEILHSGRVYYKTEGKVSKPKISVQGQSQGLLMPGEIWCKALPGIVEA